MKKTLLLIATALVAATPLTAADNGSKVNAEAGTEAPAPASKKDDGVKVKKGPWDRKKYFNIGYAMQDLTPENGETFEGKFGVSMVTGRNIFLHKKPIANMLKFAIDLGSDINYAQYKERMSDLGTSGSDGEDYGDDYDDEDMNMGRHHIDIGLHVGPSVSINPVSHLKISAFFRFVPSYSMILLNSELYQNFTPMFTYGGEISYKVIGIGIEGRSGSAKYSDMLAETEDGSETMKMKYRTNALRVYISFRF